MKYFERALFASHPLLTKVVKGVSSYVGAQGVPEILGRYLGFFKDGHLVLVKRLMTAYNMRDARSLMVKHEIQVEMEEEVPAEPHSVNKSLSVLSSQTTILKGPEKAQDISQPVLQPVVQKKTAQSTSSNTSKTTPQNVIKTVSTVTTPALPKSSVARLPTLGHDEAISPTSSFFLPRSTLDRRNSTTDDIVAKSISHDIGFARHTNGTS